ncbi:MAG: ribosome silencing factor [Pseudomonadota bacterium]|nr:ribosome silencing factor [Pseudomonadota bacterium]
MKSNKLASISKVAQLLKIVIKSLEDDKGQDILVIDLDGKATFAAYMVIVSGSSQRQLGAMANHLKEKIKKFGLSEVPIEGKNGNDWILIDGGDIVVHLFRPEIREFYALEKMWNIDMLRSSEANH